MAPAPAAVGLRIIQGLPKQPYQHNTASMNASEAERLVQEVRDSAAHCAGRALSRLRSGLGTTAPLPRLPGSVAEMHASWPVRTCAMLYHDALCTSPVSLGINVDTFARVEERPPAAGAAATTAERLDRFLSGLRASLGPPWQQDHVAAARAIAALGRSTALQLDKPRYP